MEVPKATPNITPVVSVTPLHMVLAPARVLFGPRQLIHLRTEEQVHKSKEDAGTPKLRLGGGMPVNFGYEEVWSMARQLQNPLVMAPASQT
jgi:hypothetical protein